MCHGKSKSRSSWTFGAARWMRLATGTAAALGALCLCVMGVWLLWSRQPPYALPNVIIVEPAYGAEVVAGMPLPVLANARSANKITKQELWVDGLLVYVATTRDPQGQKDFAATLLWTPKSGQHTLVARALDARDNMGTSPVVRVKVIESAAKEQPPGLLQIAKPGDTIHSIAKENAVTPDQLRQANPGLPDPPPPGDWVNIPPGNNQEGGNDDQPGGAVNDPGAAPIPPGWTLVQQIQILAFPVLDHPCRSGRRQRTLRRSLPTSTSRSGNCAAILTWRDNSNNEAGFYIYRLNRGAPDFARIATIAANNAHAALRYEDRNIGGDYQY